MAKKLTGIVVLEGADGAGKTTLAREICKRYDGLYVHLGYKKRVLLLHTAAMRWALKNAGERLVVLDRHWPSEDVYGASYRQGSGLGAMARSLYRGLNTRGAVTVICAPPVGHVVHTHQQLIKQRTEMYDKGMQQVAERYLDLVKGNILRPVDGTYVDQLSAGGGVGSRPYSEGWVHHDVSRLSLDKTPQWIAREIEHRVRWRQAALPPALSTGAHKPWITGFTGPGATVILGNIALDHRAVLPFHSVSQDAVFFNQALHKIRAEENHLCIIDLQNTTIEPDEIRAVGTLLEGARRVITVGSDAGDALMSRFSRRADWAIRPPLNGYLHPNFGDYSLELDGALYA